MKKSLVLFFVIQLFIDVNSQGGLLNYQKNFGEYQVGFKIENLTDYSRSFGAIRENYDIYRSIMIYQWYPCKISKGTKKIDLREYIKLSESDFNKQNSGFVFPPTPLMKLDNYNKLIDSYYSQAHTVLNAQVSEGQFPVIVMGQGLYYENPINHFALCELLAGNGFIVISTPLIGTNSGIVQLTVNDLESAVRDLEFLIDYASKLDYADLSKIGLLGFDMGGMAVQLLQMRNKNVDCVLTLDAGIIFQHFSGLPQSSPWYNIENLTLPWMHITEAQFVNPYRQYLSQSLWDKAKYCDRYFVLIDSVEHVNFTSNCLFNISDGLDNYWSPGALSNDKGYDIICQYALNFFNSLLYNDVKAKNFLEAGPSYSPNSQKNITIEILHKIDEPPTIDELLYAISENDSIEEIDRIKEYCLQNSDWQKFDENQVNFLGYRFVTAGKLKAAKEVFELNTFLYPESFNVYDSLGEINLILGNKTKAKENYEKSLQLNPDNENAKVILKKLNQNN